MNKSNRSQRAIAKDLCPFMEGKDVRSIEVMLGQYILGNKTLPYAWRQPLTKVLRLENTNDLLQVFPKILFAEHRPKQLANDLAPLLGIKNPRSLVSELNQVILGKTPLPSGWAPHLMEVMGCKTPDDLTKIFPAILRPAEDVVIELLVTTATAIISAAKLPDLFAFLRHLEQFGIKTEVRIRSKQVETTET